MGDKHDLQLPISNVGRIMKKILPPNAKISKEAKETMQECVTEFVKFVTGEASVKFRRDNRKTVSGDDICWALSALGFDECAELMAMYLHKHRRFEKDRIDQKLQSCTRAEPEASDYKRGQAGKQSEAHTIPLLVFKVKDGKGNSPLLPKPSGANDDFVANNMKI